MVAGVGDVVDPLQAARPRQLTSANALENTRLCVF